MRIVWLAPLVGALLGTFFLIDALLSATGAPQQAAGAAIACAMCVVPYIAARAIQEMSSVDQKETVASPAVRKPSNTAIGVAVLAMAIVGAAAVWLSYGNQISSGVSSEEAKKACLEYKEVYGNLTSPTPAQIKTAVGCRDKGYW